jgi:hypothetical protein
MSLPSVSKLKPTSPRYLPYLDMFLSIIMPFAKQALKLTLVILILLAAPPASSTYSYTHITNTTFISNICAYLYITNVTPEAFTANIYKKLFVSPFLGPPKFS